MLFSKFHYNPKTCRYERVRLKWSDVTAYLAGLLVTAGVFFVVIVFLQNNILKTETEKALRKENNILEKNHQRLTAELVTIEATLNDLKSKDEALSLKLFDTNIKDQPNNVVIQKSDVLFADAEGFQHIVESLKTKSSELAEKSSRTNQHFGNTIDLSVKELELLRSMPSRLPLGSEHYLSITSGFGVRVNPFHKGHYDHPGVDLVAPRGTVVYATGNGRVIRVNRTHVQAGYGNYIEIDHGQGFITRYAHLEDTPVRVGQKITKGFPIGTVGSSGGSVAPHVHYEIIRDGENVDPIHFMIEGMTSAQHRAMSVLARKQNQSLD